MMPPCIARLAATALTVLVAAAAPDHASAETGVLDDSVTSLDTATEDPSIGFTSGSVVVAPVPFSNPTIGSGLMLGAGYLFRFDENSNPSVIGVGALRSDNDSQAYGISVNLYADNNRWIFKSIFAEADLRYDLFTDAGLLPIRQDGRLARVSLSYGVDQALSFGGVLRYLDTTISPNGLDVAALPPPLDTLFGIEILNAGFVVDWDRRDDPIYPTQGDYWEFEATHGFALGGPVEDYSKSFLNYNRYAPISDRGVLAARLSTCATSTTTPFFDQCSLGATDGFRGFSVTQFLDLRSASLQLEYRHRFSQRLGAIAFGGAGLTGNSFSNLADGGTHTAFGVGARYRVSKKFPVDFSVDLARNDLSENQLYIYVGQRF